jgi:hypothetical protein
MEERPADAREKRQHDQDIEELDSRRPDHVEATHGLHGTS